MQQQVGAGHASSLRELLPKLIPFAQLIIKEASQMTHAKDSERKPWWRFTKATGLIGVSLATVAFAERDINRRAADEIRGSKLLWRAVSLNALGALAYLKWGRI
jgi:hypothetical protein